VARPQLGHLGVGGSGIGAWRPTSRAFPAFNMQIFADSLNTHVDKMAVALCNYFIHLEMKRHGATKYTS
jgi:hypothetical protein